MKNKLKTFLRPAWAILTDVPGWPDAPRKLRIRRLLPVALPFAAMLVLIIWNVAWRTPRIQAERKAHQPLQALEEEVTSLRLSYSDQQTKEITTQTIEASKALLQSPAELPAVLGKLKEAALSFGWESTLNVSAAPTPPSPSEAQVYFLPARGKLTPAATNAEPFKSLLAYFEKLPAADKWIDLMRLNLRADERGKLAVEIQLRIGCNVPNEKTAQ